MTQAVSEGTRCPGGFCNGAGVCLESSCNDGRRGETEADVDCGGASVCSRCVDGATCSEARDCESGVCAAGTCASRCGDGVRQMGEACDDGNQTNADGCDDGALGSCRPTGCGNGTKTGTEACDDGNALDGDGCDSNCSVSACGNGVIVGGERCDDANELGGDGCSTTCMVEPGYSCTGIPSACASVCGDGRTAGGETCDDGARTAGDGCSASCTVEAGWGCNGTPSVCATTCGDGVVAGVEACDDVAPAESGDGCSAICAVEAGWTCSGAPSTCVTTCGDGLVRGAEACDDAPPAENGDGCSASCAIETGWSCAGAPSLCAPVCGDGLRAGTEACDDAPPAESGDGCSVACVVEVGWSCQGTPSVCATQCGDGTPAGGEGCDDSNTQALDGCSATCQVEPPEVEPNDDGVPATGAPGIVGNDFDPGGVAVANATAQGVIDAAQGDTVRVASIGVDGDEDVFALTNTTSTAKSVRIDAWNGAAGFGPGRACGSSIDLGLTLRNAAGQALADANNRNGAADLCPGITFALLPNRTIYVHLVEFGDDAVVPRYGLEFRFTEIVCGDGVLTPGAEECDDGNTNDSDACSNACRVPALDETEPNNSRPTSNPLMLTGDVLVRGAISPAGDVDVFRFTTSSAQVVRLETYVGTWRDCNATSLTLRLFDAGGTEVMSDVGSGMGGCALLQVPLPVGTWFVQVERTGNASAVERYFLELTLPPQAGVESEPPNMAGGNDVVATAEQVLVSSLDAWVSGDHQLANDVDLYAVTLPPQTGLRAEIIEGDRASETCESNDIDATMSLLDSTGALITIDDDGGRGYCSRIDGLRGPSTSAAFTLARNTTAAPKIYYVRITRSQSGLTTPAQFVYRLVVTIR